MCKPYRVVVWGTGSMGKVCLREVIKRPELELAAVLVYNPEKDGIDAGELCGLPPCGVAATSDQEAVISLEADCVLWCGGFPIGSAARKMEDNVARLLESGKNVISCAAHHYPPGHDNNNDPAYAQRLKDACLKGNSSLHGTGENPGFWLERIGMALTGCTNTVKFMRLHEYCDCAKGSDGGNPGVMGFGLSEEQALAPSKINDVWEKYYYVEGLTQCSLALYNKPLEKFEVKRSMHLAKEDAIFTLAEDGFDFTVKRGHVLGITNDNIGYVDGEAKLSIAGNWFLGQKYNTFPGKEDSHWEIEIEGDPVSIRSTFDARSSIIDNSLFKPGDTISPTWYMTAILMVQAIPKAVEAKPGFLSPSVFTHCTPDLRSLATGDSIVDLDG